MLRVPSILSIETLFLLGVTLFRPILSSNINSNTVRDAYTQTASLPPLGTTSTEDQVAFGSPHCFPPAHYVHPVDVVLCRSVIDRLIKGENPDRPLYWILRREPIFEEGTPPLHFKSLSGACEIFLNTKDRLRVGQFSMSRVREVAISLLDECQHRGGRGGRQQISSVDGWYVSIAGPVWPLNRSSTSLSVNSSSLTNTNTSELALSSGPRSVHCHDAQEHPHIATVDVCRAVLTQIRSWPAFSRLQTFEAFISPRVEMGGRRMYPPFDWGIVRGNCVVELKPVAPGAIDRFSFSDVKNLATAILDSCDREGNHGGSALIGRSHGWVVDVYAVRTPGLGPESVISTS